jgi:hypothetical protein
VLVGAGLAACPPPPALAGTRQWSLLQDDSNLVGGGADRRERTLDDIARLGADTLRVQVRWSDVAPAPGSSRRPAFDGTDPAAYPGFGTYDEIVRGAAARHLRVLLTIAGDAPRWATRGARGENYRPDAAAYAQFAEAVARRYSGGYSGLPRVAWFSVWNEPNYANFLTPQSDSPRIYRSLVAAAVPALHRAGAGHVLVGELKPTAGSGIGPKAFFRRWLCLDARYRRLRGRVARRAGCARFRPVATSGFAYHPYGPLKLPRRTRDSIGLLEIRRLGAMLDRAARAGRIPRRLPIYSTEFGFQTNPPDLFVNTSPARQAALINASEEFSYRYPRLRSFAQYQLYDDPPKPGPPAVRWSGFQAGLRFANGRPKPSLEAYRFPIVVKRHGQRARIWGRVRPGQGRRYVQLQRKVGGRYVGTVRLRTSARGYFTARRPAGRYRFLAFVPGEGGNASSLRLLGKSRTARPAGGR